MSCKGKKGADPTCCWHDVASSRTKKTLTIYSQCCFCGDEKEDTCEITRNYPQFHGAFHPDAQKEVPGICPLGSWNENGLWSHNPSLGMSRTKQLEHNIKYGHDLVGKKVKIGVPIKGWN